MRDSLPVCLHRQSLSAAGTPIDATVLENDHARPLDRSQQYMYEIEETEYGARLTISGQLTPEEGEEFTAEMRAMARRLDEGFCVFADLRGMEAFPPEVGEKITELMEFCSEQGMGRSVDVVESATTTLQMEQLVTQAGIDERVIDATGTSDWESEALDWLKHATEPAQ